MAQAEPISIPARTVSTRKLCWLLFLTLFITYAYFAHRTAGWNEATRIALVRAIVEDHSLSIDRFHEGIGDKAFYKGHFYSDKAIGASLLAVPVHALLYGAFGYYSEFGTRYAITVACSALPSAIAGVLLFRLLMLLRPRATVGSNVFLTLAYGLGTIALPYSTLFFGHQLTASLLIGAVYLLVRVRLGKERGWLLFLCGFLAAFAAMTEYPAAPAAVLLGLYALFALRRKLAVAWVVLGAALPLAGEMAYDLAVFDSFLPACYLHDYNFSDVHRQGLFGLTGIHWDAVYGITISPRRGLFYLSPFLVLAIPGFYWMWRARWRAETLLCLGVFGAFFATAVNFIYWTGGWAIGPRFLTAGIPFVVIGVAFAYDRWRRLFWGLAAVGFLFLFVGTAVEPHVPPDISEVMFNFCLPLLKRGGVDATLLSLLGLGRPVALVPLVAFALGMAWVMARQLGLRCRWRSAGLPLVIGACIVGALFVMSKRSAEMVHRERGEALYWGWIWGHGTLGESKAELAQARRLDPRQYRTHLLLGKIAVVSLAGARTREDQEYYLKVLRIATQELEAAIALGPVDKDGYNALADMYDLAGRQEDAEKMRQRAATAPVPR